MANNSGISIYDFLKRIDLLLGSSYITKNKVWLEKKVDNELNRRNGHLLTPIGFAVRAIMAKWLPGTNLNSLKYANDNHPITEDEYNNFLDNKLYPWNASAGITLWAVHTTSTTTDLSLVRGYFKIIAIGGGGGGSSGGLSSGREYACGGTWVGNGYGCNWWGCGGGCSPYTNYNGGASTAGLAGAAGSKGQRVDLDKQRYLRTDIKYGVVIGAGGSASNNNNGGNGTETTYTTNIANVPYGSAVVAYGGKGATRANGTTTAGYTNANSFPAGGTTEFTWDGLSAADKTAITGSGKITQATLTLKGQPGAAGAGGPFTAAHNKNNEGAPGASTTQTVAPTAGQPGCVLIFRYNIN